MQIIQTMKMEARHILANRKSVRSVVFLLFYLFTSLPLFAQEVTVQVTPVQQVLPPQAGMYIDNPGRFFTIRLINNTDQVQQVHLGLQLEQHFPEQGLWVSTNMNNNHIPRQPIILQPNQHKTLNSIEAKHLLDHFTASDFYIREGNHYDVADGSFGLMPEGEYEVFLTAYKWDPDLTSPVVLSDPQGGNALFNICYAAQPPTFIQPFQSPVIDGLSELKVEKVNKNLPTFQWTAPTLNCNVANISYHYNLRVVELQSMMPDEAMQQNTISFYEKNISTTSLTLPTAYVNQMIGANDSVGKIYALQVTAQNSYQSQNVLNYSLLENEGKSPILLFQLYDPNYKPKEEPKDTTKTGGDDDGSLSLDSEDVDKEKEDSLYVFEQPQLTSPSFAGKRNRLVYIGDSIVAEWRKAWYHSGKGEEQDTVKFEYTLSLYTGNSADTKEIIFKSKPVYSNVTKNLTDTIKWDKIKDKVKQGDYFILRVTAKSTNEKSLRMLPDSLNYKDFVLTSRFNENYQCGNDNRQVANKNPLSEKPGPDKNIKIGKFYLTFNNDVQKDNGGGFTGTGWIRWKPQSDNFFNMNARVAVKFDKLKVNTDYEVYEGKCQTYAKSEMKVGEYTADQFVDSLFSSDGLSDIFGTLGLDEGVAEKISNYTNMGINMAGKEGKDVATNLAQSYNLGKYYSYYRKGRQLWNDWKKGDVMDLYFPVELPDEIKGFLPKDFSVQIASMQFSPQSAQMNLIAEVALPNSDVFDGQDVLIFGAPRLCISPDKFFPDEGVLALLSNFPLKDPSSDFKMVFKAPSEPLDPEPDDGCFLRWADGEFGGLGLEIAMTIPNTNRIMDGKVKKDVPALLDLKTVIRANQSAGDFIATGTLTPFEVKDLPGWSFHVGDEIVFDHNMSENDKLMPSLDEIRKTFAAKSYDEKTKTEKADGNNSTFDPKLCGTGVEADWNAWQGVFIKNVSVGFPKFSVLGGNEQGVQIGAKNMIIDGSGVTCQVFTDSLLTAETASVGGWKFTIDHAAVDIVQNNFDNCTIQGGIGVPLFKAKPKKDDKKDGAKTSDKSGGDKSGGKTGGDKSGTGGKTGDGKTGDGKIGDGKNDKKDEHQETDLRYTCEIRHLTDPSKDEKYYTYHEKRNKDGSPVRNEKGVIQYDKIEHTRHSYGDESRYSYIFTTEEVGDLDFSCFIAEATLTKEQTYFVVEAEDNLETGETDTRVELCVGGDLSIGGLDSADERLQELGKKLNLPLKIPGVHFAKFRISNKKRDDWHSTYASVKRLQEGRDAYDEKWAKDNKVLKTLLESEEMKITDECYLDLGEWSLASARKKLGPFSFNLDKFKPSYSGGNLTLAISGDIGLVEDKLCVGAGVTISSKVDISKGFKEISLSDGEVKFDSIHVGVDFTALRFDGSLYCRDDGEKGYEGKLDIAVTGLFSVKCEGGFFEHQATDADMAEKETEAKELAAKEGRTFDAETDLDQDRSYSWGYFKCTMESTAGLRIDPVVINRIAGGFYFNCRPTKGSDPDDKFGGRPEGQYGMIGVAIGLGMSTSAGEETLKADVDLLVVYDRQNSCLSTFMFNGKLSALSDMLHSDVSLVYENSKDKAGQTIERYLCLNVTAEFGADVSALKDRILSANGRLTELKGKLDEFQSKLDGIDIGKLVTDPKQGLDNLAGNYETSSGKDKGTEAKKEEDVEFEAGKSKITMELLITWKKKNLPAYDKPKWHLYVGEPDKDKRCTFTYLKFKSKIVTVDIGADGYICIGNELPNNGKLPPIPDDILEFLGGHKADGVDMGADAQKAEGPRQQAAMAMDNPRGGVMVGASCWGNIDLDLGLIYGGIHSLAGFDASLINYGANAVCVNTGSNMGWYGWYAMGQLYAKLEAELGIRIKIGKLINEEDVPLLYAGIGGLLEMGLPNPSWIEGQLRVKMSFLSGLFKVDKKFTFAAGDHCVPFVGNALDGFEMFQGVSLGSDSIYQALYKPEFAISKNDASRMTFSTNTSLGTHYRLVDPSYSAYTGNDSTLNLHNSRTYVFDMNKDKVNGMKMGVRLFDLGELPTQLATGGETLDEIAFKNKLLNKETSSASGGLKEHSSYNLNNLWDKSKSKEHMANLHNSYPTMTAFLADYFYKRETTTAETSTVMNGKDINSGEKRVMEDTGVASYIDYILDNNVNADGLVMNDAKEVDVSFREDKGTNFHLTGMNLEPGHSYMLVLFGDAYEIKNGRKQWVDYYYDEDGNGKPKYVPIKWKQSKLWFFRVKSEAEDEIKTDSLRDLNPYVALAYPSTDGTNVTSNPGEEYTTAYINDILHPTIALNRDIRDALPKNKMTWVLTAYHANDTTKSVNKQTRAAEYRLGNTGNCINLEPLTAFNKVQQFTTDATSAVRAGRTYSFSNELYNLLLNYTYKAGDKDSTVTLVNLWLTAAPHDVTVNGKTYDDNWQESTNSSITGKLLPYTAPFVGARPWQDPTVGYKKLYDGLLTSDKRNDDLYTINNRRDGKGNVMSYNDLPLRLVDPYLYLAYLSKYTFIPDRAINKYDFDDVAIPFGSESMTFQKGTTLVNAVSLMNDTGNNLSLLEQRNLMDSICNTWAYANEDLPQYPLPVTLQTIGGPTTPNQDERTATIRPMNVNYESDFTLNLSDLVKDYAAPYDVASQMCTKLKRNARQLFDTFTWYMVITNTGSFNNNAFNDSILKWNKLHRGQYLQVTVGDVTAKVPYYQLPLIFGDCFGHDEDGNQARYKGIKLDRKNRSFRASIGSDDLSTDRYKSATSNLYFFRLIGNKGFADEEPEVFMRYKSGHVADYLYPANDPKAMQVSLDSYDANEGLKSVTDFKARIYRVDTYDISTGLYTLSGKNMGGGPWYTDVTIDKNNGTAKNLNDMYGVVKENEAFLATHHDTPQPYALFDYNAKKLTFLSTNEIINEGDTYNGINVTRLWVGDDCRQAGWQNSDWKSIVQTSEKVVIDPSFADTELPSTSKWFSHFANMTSIEGLQYLNTEKTTDMSGMFEWCGSLQSIDLNILNTENVENMTCMFDYCKNLKSVNMGQLNLKKLTTINQIFDYCEALTDVDLRSLEGKKVSNCAFMFYQCRNLKTLHIDRFSPQNVETYSNMFNAVPNTLKAYIDYYLDERIKSQIPGQAIEGGNPNRAVMATDGNNKYVFVLMKASDDNNPQVNKTFSVTAGGTTYSNLTAKKIWTADQVMCSAASGNWGSYTYRSSVTKVLIADDFTDAPENIEGWFNGFGSLEEIVGLPTLNTSKVTSLKDLFRGCGKLKTLDLSAFNTKQITDMSYMFNECKELEELNSEAFEASNVTNMQYMFANCQNLKHIPYILNTVKVTNMQRMFYNCAKLENLDEVADGFYTDNVTNMAYMFYGCKTLKKFDLIGYNTKKVNNMTSMFENCTALDLLMLNDFSSEALSSANNMFRGMKSSCTVYLPYDIGNKVYPTQISETTFPNLQLVYPSKVLLTENGGDGYKMIFLSSKTTYTEGTNYTDGNNILRVYKHVMTKATDSFMDSNDWQSDNFVNGENAMAKVVKVIFDSSFSVVKPITISRWFDGMTNLRTIVGMQYLNTADVTSMDNLFRDCTSLQTLDLSYLNTGNVTNMYNMFRNCSSLTTLDLSAFNTGKVKDISDMFMGCTALQSVKFGNFNATSMDGYLSGLFEDCKSLKSVDLSWLEGLKIKSMAAMFRGCQSLESLDLSMIDNSGCSDNTSMSGIFNNCKSLKKLTIGPDFHTVKTSQSYDYQIPFKNVTDLAVQAPMGQRIQQRDAFVSDLGFADGDTGWFEGLQEEEDQPVAQVIWTESNGTLNFYYGKQRKVGGTYGGHTVTKVWSGEDVTNRTYLGATTGQWQNCGINDKVKTVIFDKTFANVMPHNTVYWFNLFTNLTSIEGMEYLNTSQVTNMTSMFRGCDNLTSIDLSHFNTANVTSMANMFRSCSSLKELNLTTFNTKKVNSASNMFNGCKGLEKLKVGSNFTFDAITQKATNVFAYLPFMDVIITPGTSLATVKTALVDKLGWTSSNGHLSNSEIRSGYALWVDSEKTLYFVHTTPFVTGDYFWRGKTVTNVWATSGTGWLSTVQNSMTKAVFENSFAEEGIRSTANWFKSCSKLTTVEGWANLNTNSLFSMFEGCTALTSINLSDLNLKEVTSMGYTFNGCTALKSVTFGSNTQSQKLTTMRDLFVGCTALTTIKMSGVNTENVTDMEAMFQNCSSLTTLNHSLNMQNVTNAASMFRNCGLKTVYLGTDMLTKVTTTSNMFAGCKNLTTVTISLNMPENKTMENMFNGCSSLTTFTGKVYTYNGTPTKKVQSMKNMFYGCSELTSVSGINDLHTEAVTTMENMFNGCAKLQTTIQFNYSTAKVTSMERMFYGCSKLTGAYFLGSVEKVTSMADMFNGCSNMSSVSFKTFNANALTTTANMFNNCTNLQRITWRSSYEGGTMVSTPNLTNMKGMFNNCSQLATLDLSEFTTTKVTDMSYMFNGCKQLPTNVPSQIKTDKVTTMQYMFYGCEGLYTVDVSQFSTNNVTTTEGMFSSCKNLRSINLGAFNLAKMTNMSYMFSGCTSLESLEIKGQGANLSNMKAMFWCCSGLTELKMKNLKTTNVTDMEMMLGYCSNLTSWTIGSDFVTTNVTKKNNVFVGITSRSLVVHCKQSNVSHVDALGFTRTVGYYDYPMEKAKSSYSLKNLK